MGPQLEAIPTRKNYRYQTIDPDLGDTMQVWHVQAKNWPEVDSGLVSTLYGFADSPDAEVFAQGVAMKGPDTVALARQGNFFLWGFSAAPDSMTPSGQRLFVNVVAYMREFDGQRPLVRLVAHAREFALRNALLPREIAENVAEKMFKDAEPVFREHFKVHPELSKEFEDIDSYLANRKTAYAKAYATEFETALPAELRERFGTDSDKYLAYYRENLEFLRPAGADSYQFVVDEDAKTVGPSNRKIELLDRCVSMLESQRSAGIGDAAARTLHARELRFCPALAKLAGHKSRSIVLQRCRRLQVLCWAGNNPANAECELTTTPDSLKSHVAKTLPRWSVVDGVLLPAVSG